VTSRSKNSNFSLLSMTLFFLIRATIRSTLNLRNLNGITPLYWSTLHTVLHHKLPPNHRNRQKAFYGSLKRLVTSRSKNSNFSLLSMTLFFLIRETIRSTLNLRNLMESHHFTDQHSTLYCTTNCHLIIVPFKLPTSVEWVIN